MKENDPLERHYKYNNDNPWNSEEKLSERDFINNVKKNEDNYIITADGGMGKSYVAKEWAKKYNFSIIKAQEIKWENLKNNLIIDNFDEVEINKSVSILKWVSRSNWKRIIIFSRPENVAVGVSSFVLLKMHNSGERNMRYEKMGSSGTYESMEKFFKKTLKVDSMLFDFISVFSFSLLTKSKIHMHEEDAFEFIRKYNINNNSSINLELLYSKNELFKKIGEDIYFENKTIPAFFVISFLKKMAHIKNSYISYFNNFASQVSFKESAQIMIKDKNKKGLSIAWDLVSKNNFFFMFIIPYEAAKGIEPILSYGKDKMTKSDFTQLFTKIQITCSKEKNINSSIYILGYEDIFKNIDMTIYMKNIILVFKENKVVLKRIIGFFLNWMKHLLIKNNEQKKIIENIIQNQIKPIYHGLLDTPYFKNRAIVINEYIFGLRELKTLSQNDYKNYSGPVESAIEYLVLYDKEKAVRLIAHYDYDKLPYSNEIIKKTSFLEWLIEKEYFVVLFSILRQNLLTPEENVSFLNMMNANVIKKELFSRNNRQYNFKKIFVTKEWLDRAPEILSTKFYVNVVKKASSNTTVTISEIIESMKNIKDHKFEKYLKKDSLNFWQVHDIKLENGTLSKEFVKDKLQEVDQCLMDKNFVRTFKSFEPILQIFKQLNCLEDEQLSENMLLLRNRYDLHRAVSSEKKWFNIKKNLKNKKIAQYFSQIDRFKKLVHADEDYLFLNHIIDILEKMDRNTREEAIKLLYKESIEKDCWWNVYLKYYDESQISKEAAQNMNWEPQNAKEMVSYVDKVKLWLKNNKLHKVKIKDLFKELINSNFNFLHDFVGVSSIDWYDDFFGFGIPTSDDLKKKLLDFLSERKLIEWFYNEFKRRFIKLFNENENSISIYLEFLFDVSNLSKNILADQEVAEIKKMNLNGQALAFLNRTLILKYPIGIFDEVNDKKFKISEFYRYMNEEMNIFEMSNIFEHDIVPLIANVVKDMPKGNQFETNAHKKINKLLPKILMNKYSIIYQPESNPFNIDDPKKRIDFILSLDNKYIFVELKSSKNPHLTEEKLYKQLETYDDSYGMIKQKILLIFKIHNISNDKKINIEKAASLAGFKTLYINIK